MSTTITSEPISLTRTVGEIATAIPSSTRVFQKYGVDYCCGGGISLAEACERAGVASDELIASLEALAVAPVEKNWTTESLTSLHRHIIATHHVYTREELRLLDELAQKVARVHGENHPETKTVSRIVSLMHPELFQHMMKEEQILFPFIEELEAAVSSGGETPTPFFGTVENPIRMMMAEHDQAGEMLREIRTATNDYELPDDACGSYRALYARLQELEADLHQHIHLENNIYFPRAIELQG